MGKEERRLAKMSADEFLNARIKNVEKWMLKTAELADWNRKAILKINKDYLGFKKAIGCWSKCVNNILHAKGREL